MNEVPGILFDNRQFQFNDTDSFVGSALWYDKTNLRVGVSAPGARLEIRGSGTATGFALRISDSTPTDRLVVLDNGNVGIGTTAPAAKLEIYGVTSTISNSAGNINIQPAGNLTVTQDVAIATSKKVILDSDDNSDTYIVHDAAGNYLSIYVDNVEVARAEP